MELFDGGKRCLFPIVVSLFGGKTSFNIPARGHVLTGYNDGDFHKQGSGRRRTAWCLSDYWSIHVGVTSELDYQVTIL